MYLQKVEKIFFIGVLKVHYEIAVSGSVSKCHGSATLLITNGSGSGSKYLLILGDPVLNG